ncbi:hypothetical protein V5T82_13300 [Magnetovibrio sp. PR-2]|uniref:hypothetical protein n=1 Tax=Magnetovibrio sp. PR-2 TaxID=3120356 RepID=UPI002FCE1DA2
MAKRTFTRAFTRTIEAGLLGLMALGLAACATDEGPPPPCPEIRILGGAEKLTRFRPGNGRDIIDVVHEEQMTGFGGACQYEYEDDGSAELTVLIAPQILSERGPANAKGKSSFEYFIALTDSSKNIIKRDTFSVDLTYTASVPRLAWQRTEPYEVTLALKPGETGQTYRFYLGLKLTRDELQYQLKNR